MKRNDKPLFGIPELTGIPNADARKIWRRCYWRSLRYRNTWFAMLGCGLCAGACSAAGSALWAALYGGRAPMIVLALSGAVGGLIGSRLYLKIVLPLTRRLIRAELGLSFCRTCDYDLTGNISGICPECGTPIPSTPQAGE